MQISIAQMEALDTNLVKYILFVQLHFVRRSNEMFKCDQALMPYKLRMEYKFYLQLGSTREETSLQLPLQELVAQHCTVQYYKCWWNYKELWNHKSWAAVCHTYYILDMWGATHYHEFIVREDYHLTSMWSCHVADDLPGVGCCVVHVNGSCLFITWILPTHCSCPCSEHSAYGIASLLAC